MIKIRLERKLLYVFAVFIISYIRKGVVFLIDVIYGFDLPLINLFLMNLGQITGGLTIYTYQLITLNRHKEIYYFHTNLIHKKNIMLQQDKNYKVFLLIFLAAFFDFIEFIFSSFYFPKISYVPSINGSKLGSFSIISSSLICTYALGFKLGKHLKFSLITLGICLILTILLESLYISTIELLSMFIFAYFFIIIYLTTISFTDCIERYLADVDYKNPFIIIMIEGIFEFCMSSIYSIGKEPFRELKYQYEQNDTGKFILLIFILFIYLLLSAALNAYKIYVNVTFSPTARSFMDFLLNPFFNIYYFTIEDDFNKNYFYFFANEIICFIIDFFACVYNEYLILFCCGLEFDTKDEIAKRSKNIGTLGFLLEDDYTNA